MKLLNVTALILLSVTAASAQEPADSGAPAQAMIGLKLPAITGAIHQIMCIGFHSDDKVIIRFGDASAKWRSSPETASGEVPGVSVTYTDATGILTIARAKDKTGRFTVEVTVPKPESPMSLILTTDGRPSKATMMPVLGPLRLANGEITPLTNL